MKCEDCSHAEMCRWIDELEGRGCDFCDEKPCELLILKSDILLHQDDKKKWAEIIEREREKGLIILPPYFTPLLIPNDVEIRIEKEPCDDAISRDDVWNILRRGDFRDRLSYEEFKKRLEQLPSVTQKSGKWINKDVRKEEYVLIGKCSVCGQVRVKDKFCSNCGAKMVEPQESETWNGIHGQITAPKGTFKKIWKEA